MALKGGGRKGGGPKPRKSEGQEGGNSEGWAPPKLGGQRVGGPNDGGPKGGGPKVGGWGGRGQNFALFFLSPAFFFLFFLSLGFFSCFFYLSLSLRDFSCFFSSLWRFSLVFFLSIWRPSRGILVVFLKAEGFGLQKHHQKFHGQHRYDSTFVIKHTQHLGTENPLCIKFLRGRSEKPLSGTEKPGGVQKNLFAGFQKPKGGLKNPWHGGRKKNPPEEGVGKTPLGGQFDPRSAGGSKKKPSRKTE